VIIIEMNALCPVIEEVLDKTRYWNRISLEILVLFFSRFYFLKLLISSFLIMSIFFSLATDKQKTKTKNNLNTRTHATTNQQQQNNSTQLIRS